MTDRPRRQPSARWLRFLHHVFHAPTFFGVRPWVGRLMPGKDRSRATRPPLTGRQRHRRYRLEKQFTKHGVYTAQKGR